MGVVQIQVSFQLDALIGGPVIGVTRYFFLSRMIFHLDAVSVRSCVLIIQQ